MARRDPVVVCGGGAAGMAAALAAARAGGSACLVEAAPHTGGTVANVLIHTIGGFFDMDCALLNSGLTQELIQRLSAADQDCRPRRLGRTWVLNVCPDEYRAVTDHWLREQPGITIVLNGRVKSLTKVGGAIKAVEIASPKGKESLYVHAVIDATGTAEVVRLADADLVHDEPGRAAGGLIARLSGVTPGSLEFPRGVGLVRALREAAANGKLAPELAFAWVDSGVRPDEAFLKLMVPLPDHGASQTEHAAVVQRAREQAAAAIAFLRPWPGFAAAHITRLGEIGVRDGGMVKGEYCLTGEDVRQARKFPDAACRCCWPIEFWDPQRGVTLEYLPANQYYDIPLRSLKVPGIRNLWVAGKCLSADRQAHASARIAGTCWAMGAAVGHAAAL